MTPIHSALAKAMADEIHKPKKTPAHRDYDSGKMPKVRHPKGKSLEAKRSAYSDLLHS